MERIDLARHRSALRARWRNGGEWDRQATKIAVGELPDGRWYAQWYTLGCDWPACVYAGPNAQWYATRTAMRWRRTFGGDWVKV